MIFKVQLQFLTKWPRTKPMLVPHLVITITAEDAREIKLLNPPYWVDAQLDFSKKL